MSDPAREHESLTALATAAAGESVTAERLGAQLVTEHPARLVDVLDTGEQPQYLLDGVMADRVRASGERSRRMATPGGHVFTLVTDRAVHLVVQYRDRLAVETVSLSEVDGTTIERAGGETRLRLELADERYDVYPSSTRAAETDAVAAYIDEWTASSVTEDGDDTVSTLERLAGLYERGLLTDEEFTAAKRDLFQ